MKEALTPRPSDNILDNLLDVSKLAPETLNNNIAFNVRLVPSPKDTLDETVTRMADMIKTYFEQGGHAGIVYHEQHRYFEGRYDISGILSRSLNPHYS